jgi:hypothetical protein
MFSRFVRPQTVSALHNSSKNFGTSTQVAIFAHSVFQNLNSRYAGKLMDYPSTWTMFKDNLLRGSVLLIMEHVWCLWRSRV